MPAMVCCLAEADVCGEGAFGAVQIGTATWPGWFGKSMLVAVKSSRCGGMRELENFQREMEIMSQLAPHVNVVRLLGVLPKGRWLK